MLPGAMGTGSTLVVLRGKLLVPTAWKHRSVCWDKSSMSEALRLQVGDLLIGRCECAWPYRNIDADYGWNKYMDEGDAKIVVGVGDDWIVAQPAHFTGDEDEAEDVDPELYQKRELYEIDSKDRFRFFAQGSYIHGVLAAHCVRYGARWVLDQTKHVHLAEHPSIMQANAELKAIREGNDWGVERADASYAICHTNEASARAVFDRLEAGLLLKGYDNYEHDAAPIIMGKKGIMDEERESE